MISTNFESMFQVRLVTSKLLTEPINPAQKKHLVVSSVSSHTERDHHWSYTIVITMEINNYNNNCIITVVSI